MTSTSKTMTKGTQRLIAAADIKHHLFPMSLFLIREELMNSVRYNAKNIWIRMTERADGSVRIQVEDNGTGDASRERLSAPAETNGGGTSRYGAGLWVTRLKRGGDQWSVAWKVAGSDRATGITNADNNAVTSYLLGDRAIHPWLHKEQHGFIHTSTILPAKLEGVKLADVAATLREIMCASMAPNTLKNVMIDITVTNASGSVVSQMNSKADKWVTFEEAVFSRPDTVVWARTVIPFGSMNITATFAEIKLKKKKNLDYIKDFPHYGALSAPHAMLSQEGFTVADMRLHEALNKKPHPSSYNKKYMFVTFDLIDGETDVELLPTPASTKTSFLSDCPRYIECMAAVRANQPTGWAIWKKSEPDASPVSSVASPVTPVPVEPVPAKKRGRPAKPKSPVSVPEVLVPEPVAIGAGAGPPKVKVPLKMRKIKTVIAPAPKPAPVELPPSPLPETPKTIPVEAPPAVVVPTVDLELVWFHESAARLRALFERYPGLKSSL
jgi:hypothetical protein